MMGMGVHGETQLFPIGMGFSAQGLFISTKLPLKGQMLLAKTGPRVAHQQISQGHSWGERLQLEERGVLGWGQPGKAGGGWLCLAAHPSRPPGRKPSFS